MAYYLWNGEKQEYLKGELKKSGTHCNVDTKTSIFAQYISARNEKKNRRIKINNVKINIRMWLARVRAN